jgi:glyoxylase-like metal-dependent hydrolase (beta-lactamase superfamily II)
MKSKRIVMACALVAAGVVAVVAEGQRQVEQGDGGDLSIEAVAGRVHMVQRPGGMGNVGLFVGPDGVLLVDSLFATDNLVEAVRAVTNRDVRFLVSTHIHGDHVGGNETLAELGVLIFSHDNTRLHFLSDRTRFPRRGGTFRPQYPVAARPVITYSDTLTFHLNGEQVQLFLAPSAHTDGDTIVYFPDSDVLHLGDVFRTTSYPVIDRYNGGSLAGTIAALERAIAMAGPATKVIPGHGLSVVGRESMQEFLDMILDVRARVLASIDEGMTLEATMAARPTATYDAVWGQEAGWTADDFVPIVYHELGGQR